MISGSKLEPVDWFTNTQKHEQSREPRNSQGHNSAKPPREGNTLAKLAEPYELISKAYLLQIASPLIVFDYIRYLHVTLPNSPHSHNRTDVF